MLKHNVVKEEAVIFTASTPADCEGGSLRGVLCYFTVYFQKSFCKSKKSIAFFPINW